MFKSVVTSVAVVVVGVVTVGGRSHGGIHWKTKYAIFQGSC